MLKIFWKKCWFTKGAGAKCDHLKLKVRACDPKKSRNSHIGSFHFTKSYNACKYPFDNLIFFAYVFVFIANLLANMGLVSSLVLYLFFTSQRLHIHNHYLSSNECIITQLTVWTTKFFQWRFLIKLFYERHKKGIPIRKWRTTAKTATSDNFNHSP